MQILDEIKSMLGQLLAKSPAAPKTAAAADEPEKKTESSVCKSCNGTGMCADCHGEGELHAKIAKLESDLTGAQTSIAAKDAENAKLKADHLAELTSVKAQVAAAIAAQGLAPDKVPATTIESQPGSPAKTKAQIYSELCSKDPQKASAFYAENSEAILKG
jgi:Tfp pilus assembly protein FimV